jgi:hypothetical protein
VNKKGADENLTHPLIPFRICLFFIRVSPKTAVFKFMFSSPASGGGGERQKFSYRRFSSQKVFVTGLNKLI